MHSYLRMSCKCRWLEAWKPTLSGCCTLGAVLLCCFHLWYRRVFILPHTVCNTTLLFPFVVQKGVHPSACCVQYYLTVSICGTEGCSSFRVLCAILPYCFHLWYRRVFILPHAVCNTTLLFPFVVQKGIHPFAYCVQYLDYPTVSICGTEGCSSFCRLCAVLPYCFHLWYRRVFILLQTVCSTALLFPPMVLKCVYPSAYCVQYYPDVSIYGTYVCLSFYILFTILPHCFHSWYRNVFILL